MREGLLRQPIEGEKIGLDSENREALDYKIAFLRDEAVEACENPQKIFSKQKEAIQNSIDKLKEEKTEGYEYAVKRLEGDLAFLRPPYEDDVEYRLRVGRILASELQQIPKESLDNLRFHATSICAAEAIIRAGKITSAVDHAGTQASKDEPGFISVTTSKTIQTSIHDYLDVDSVRYCVPMGCLFVVRPRDTEDAKRGELLMMGNVEDLHVQLERILVSSEMLPQVQRWLRDSNFDPNLAIECFGYVKELRGSQKQAA